MSNDYDCIRTFLRLLLRLLLLRLLLLRDELRGSRTLLLNWCRYAQWGQ